MSDKDYIGEYDIVWVPDENSVRGTLGIGLGFLTHNDSYSIAVYPGDGYLRFDGKDIYFIDKDGRERQSHTVNYAIQIWLEKGLIARREQKEHDLSAKVWGRNYNIMKIIDEGQRLECAIWATPTPKVGDFLLLRNSSTSDGRTRYRVDAIRTCDNPQDMAFVELSFAPRQEVKP